MAAQELIQVALPSPWTYGVTSDGRVFFINDHSHSTTWLHPKRHHPVQSGHLSRHDLPKGFEYNYLPEGTMYFTDHINLKTTFTHPITGQPTAIEAQQQQPSLVHDSSDPRRHSMRRRNGKQKVLDRTPSAKRNIHAPVAIKGWLYKQESSGLKSWKKKWFVLSDYCLYYYKDETERQTSGSILLPSYKISVCDRGDGVSRRFAFKAEHENMRTYFFASDTEDDMMRWMNAMNGAALLQQDPSQENQYNTRYPQEDDRDAGFYPQQYDPHQQQFDPRQQQYDPQQQQFDPRQQQFDPRQQQFDPRQEQFDPRQEQFDPRQQQYDPHEQYDPRQQHGYYGDQGDPHGHQPEQHSQDYGRPKSWHEQPGGYRDDNYADSRYAQRLSQQEEQMQYGKENYLNYAEDPSRQSSSDRGYESDVYGRGKPHKYRPDWNEPVQTSSNVNLPRDSSTLPLQDHSNAPQQNRPELYAQDRLSYPGDQNYSRDPRSPDMNDYNQKGYSPQESSHYQGHENLSRGQGHESLNRVQGHETLNRGRDHDPYNTGDRRLDEQLQVDTGENRDLYNAYGISRQREAPQEQSLWRSPSLDRKKGNWKSLSATLFRDDDQPYQPATDSAEASQERTWQSPDQYGLDHDQGQGRSWRSPAEVQKSRDSHMPQYQTAPVSGQSPHDNRYPDDYAPYHQGNTDSQSRLSPTGYSPSSSSSGMPNRPPLPSSYRDRLDQQPDQQLPEDRNRGQQHYGDPYWQPQAQPQTQGENQPTTYTDQVNKKYTAPEQRREKRQKNLSIIKEDPAMGDSDVNVPRELKNIQKMLTNRRYRFSISAGDLIGKSHEELVLLLIRLRREKKQLEQMRYQYSLQLDKVRPLEHEYQRQSQYSPGGMPHALESAHEQFTELKTTLEQIDTEMEVQKPLINLLHNLVTMGSLYGGDNLMFATQYKKDKLHPDDYRPPKQMIEFTRQHQEEQLTQEQQEELRQLNEDEANLEERVQRLHQLDRELQEHSLTVRSLQEDKQLLEQTLDKLHHQGRGERDPWELERLNRQSDAIEQELTRVRQDLAHYSKLLEETATENARVENEIVLLRKKISGELKSHSTPSLSSESFRHKQQLEKELDSMATVMEGLSKQGAKLSQAMASLSRSTPDLSGGSSPEEQRRMKKMTYFETDLDTMETIDLAPPALRQADSGYTSPREFPRQLFQHDSGEGHDNQRSYQGQGQRGQSSQSPQYSPVDLNTADENMKRFYGVSQQEAPRHTVRDVKKKERRTTEPRSQSLPRSSADYEYQAPRSSHKDDYQQSRSSLHDEHQQSRSSLHDEHQQSRSSHQDEYQQSRSSLHAEHQTSRSYPWRDTQRSPPGGENLGYEETQNLQSYPQYSNTDGGSFLRGKSMSMRTSRDSQPPEMYGSSQQERSRTPPPTCDFDPRYTGPAPVSNDSRSSLPGLPKKPVKVLPEDADKSAQERLFPVYRPVPAPSSNPMSQERTQRMSELFTPRPYGARPRSASGNYSLVSRYPPRNTEDEGRSDAQYQQQQHPTIATVRPVIAPVSAPEPTNQSAPSQQPQPSVWSNPNTAAVKPWPIRNRDSEESANRKSSDDSLKRGRRGPKERYLTVSSSKPVSLEGLPAKRTTYHSSTAGDLIPGLFSPEKVFIPERYMPEPETPLTLEERQERQERADRIRKMLAKHSLQEFTDRDIEPYHSDVHKNVRVEEKRREQVLDIRQALAREVTEKTRQAAAMRQQSFKKEDYTEGEPDEYGRLPLEGTPF